MALFEAIIKLGINPFIIILENIDMFNTTNNYNTYKGETLNLIFVTDKETAVKVAEAFGDKANINAPVETETDSEQPESESDQ